MATTLKWVAVETPTAALTTQLNSLGNGAQSAASATIDNTTGLYQWITLELVLASLTPTGTPYCLVYLLKSQDGTNFEDLSTSARHAVLGTFPMSTATAAKRIILANLFIPPLKFQLALENETGVSLGASGNTLTYARHYEQSV